MSSLYTSHHSSSSLYHNITIWFPILLNIIILDIIVQGQMLQAMLRSLIQAHHHYHIHLIYIMISSPSSSLSSHQHDDLQRKWVATTKTTKLRTRRTLRILMAKVPTWTGCRCCRCCYRCCYCCCSCCCFCCCCCCFWCRKYIDKKKHDYKIKQQKPSHFPKYLFKWKITFDLSLKIKHHILIVSWGWFEDEVWSIWSYSLFFCYILTFLGVLKYSFT